MAFDIIVRDAPFLGRVRAFTQKCNIRGRCAVLAPVDLDDCQSQNVELDGCSRIFTTQAEDRINFQHALSVAFQAHLLYEHAFLGNCVVSGTPKVPVSTRRRDLGYSRRRCVFARLRLLRGVLARRGALRLVRLLRALRLVRLLGLLVSTPGLGRAFNFDDVGGRGQFVLLLEGPVLGSPKLLELVLCVMHQSLWDAAQGQHEGCTEETRITIQGGGITDCNFGTLPTLRVTTRRTFEGGLDLLQSRGVGFSWMR